MNKSEEIRLEYLKKFNSLIDKLKSNWMLLQDISKALDIKQSNLSNIKEDKQKAQIWWLIDKIELLKEIINKKNNENLNI